MLWTSRAAALGSRHDAYVTFDEWLARQTGVVRRSAAADATADDAAFRRAVRAGDLVHVTHDLYLPAHAVLGAVDLAARTRALADACGPNAFASNATAAELHGVAVLRCCGRVHLTRPPGRGFTAYRTPDVDLRLAELPAHHCSEIRGVPVVSVARAVIDVARTRPFVDGVVAVDSALHAGLDPDLLRQVLSDCAGWPGINRARAVVAFADPLAESALESAGRVVMHEQGLPRPVLQHRLIARDGRAFRVDYYFPEQRTVGEADGLAKYRSDDRDIAQSQHDRDVAIADLDLEIVHFSWADVFVRPGAQLAARFRRAFARGERRRSAG